VKALTHRVIGAKCIMSIYLANSVNMGVSMAPLLDCPPMTGRCMHTAKVEPMKTSVVVSTRRHPVIAYALLTYAISWTLVLPLVLNSLGLTHLPLPPGWHALAALGPIAAAFIMAKVTSGRKGVIALRRSMGRWQVGWFWWLVAVGSPLLMLALSVLLVGFVSGQWLDVSSVLTSPATFSFWLVSGVLTGVIYGFGEEPGWRGFALPRLEKRWNALIATLLVFVIWALYHTPFFFYQYSFSLGTMAGFLIGLLAGAFWLTYLYNSTGGSVLIAMCWHALFNVVSAIAQAADPSALAVISMLAILLGLVAVVVGRPTRLSSSPASGNLRDRSNSV
jgi:membrane protease YdiL (CAAX protease family)